MIIRACLVINKFDSNDEIRRDAVFTVIPDQAGHSGLIRSISCLFSLWAFQRSTARCAFNQNSGVFPNNPDNHKDMAGDTARRSNNSSLTVWRETPSFFASPAVVVRLKSGMKSSHRDESALFHVV
jgi:hypothetical protein